MPEPSRHDCTYDVLAVGNAIVDILAGADEAFLDAQGLHKGAMALVDAERSAALYEAMGPGVEISGGSAANTVVGVASFGGRDAFIGRVRDDQLGEVFGHDLRAAGVHYAVPAGTLGPPTARCLILFTPDGQRTMNTFLGASGLLAPADVDTDLVASAAVTYCEGYLWDAPDAKAAMAKAMDAARSAGRTVAFTLSDGFCVDRHRDEFLALLAERVDVLFANETEICSLYEVDDFAAALAEVRRADLVACLTRSEMGSVVVAADAEHHVDAHPVDAVVDTTGAGDLYAAGFLHGWTTGRDLATCGRLGSLAAAEIISHVGARPATVLADLAATELAG
ncbi:adenosine kinase [soil metagenome]